MISPVNPPPIPPKSSPATPPPISPQLAWLASAELELTEKEVRMLSGPKISGQYDRSLRSSWRDLLPKWFPWKAAVAAGVSGWYFEMDMLLLAAGAGAIAGLGFAAKHMLEIRKTRQQLKRHLQLREEIKKYNEAIENLKTHVQVTQILQQGVEATAMSQRAIDSVKSTRDSLVRALRLERLLSENPRYRMPQQNAPEVPHESLSVISRTSDDMLEWKTLFETTHAIEERLYRDFPTQGLDSGATLDSKTLES
jgi:hypothetical protein